ncbi:MAG: hypothetical protein INR73_18815 [Williamsia sp.]|nr:hypothetical protein [Williamsia sp.]
MFNPFARFIPELIDAFRTQGERYLVSETFHASVDVFTEGNTELPFCLYNDLAFAQIHLQAVRADHYIAIIDLGKEKHLAKVQEMLAPASPYLIYSNLVHDNPPLTDLLDKDYAPKLRKYIERHTTWRIYKNGSLKPKIQLIFRELFVVVRFQLQQLRIKFANIENY